MVIRPITIQQRPVIVPRLYAEPLARDYPSDTAPSQPNTEPLQAVPVAQPSPQVVVIGEKEIHHAPTVVPSSRPIKIVVQAPEHSTHPIQAAIAQSPDREQECVEIVPIAGIATDEGKSLTPDNKKFNEPLNFSPRNSALQAEVRKKFHHQKRDQGRQRKFHQTIALLELYHDGDSDQFNRLDEQMRRYYQREYPEYFGRDSKSKAEKRLANRTRATRTRRDSERRRIAEISRGVQTVSHHRLETMDAHNARSERDVHSA